MGDVWDANDGLVLGASELQGFSVIWVSYSRGSAPTVPHVRYVDDPVGVPMTENKKPVWLSVAMKPFLRAIKNGDGKINKATIGLTFIQGQEIEGLVVPDNVPVVDADLQLVMTVPAPVRNLCVESPDSPPTVATAPPATACASASPAKSPAAAAPGKKRKRAWAWRPPPARLAGRTLRCVVPQ